MHPQQDNLLSQYELGIFQDVNLHTQKHMLIKYLLFLIILKCLKFYDLLGSLNKAYQNICWFDPQKLNLEETFIDFLSSVVVFRLSMAPILY